MNTNLINRIDSFIEKQKINPRFRLMGRGYPRLIGEESIPKKKKKDTYFCGKCFKWHLIYSNIGNEHKDFKASHDIKDYEI